MSEMLLTRSARRLAEELEDDGIELGLRSSAEAEHTVVSDNGPVTIFRGGAAISLPAAG